MCHPPARNPARRCFAGTGRGTGRNFALDRKIVRTSQFATWLLAAAVGLTGVSTASAVTADDAAIAAPAAAPPDNAICLVCHGGSQPTPEVTGAGGKSRHLRAINPDRFGKGVHARLHCVACHTNITEAAGPHRRSSAPPPDCAQCHEKLWEQAKQAGSTGNQPHLGIVARNIEAYRKSFHARPDTDHPTQPKAACTQCHDTHFFNVPADKKSPQYDAWRKEIPALCGETCHEDQLETFAGSVHGKAVLDKGNAKAPVCTSCHTSHEITNTSLVSFKLLNNEDCGSCHETRLRTYRDTYHGQVTRLGYVETAKCYDCHGSHGVLPASDPQSKVHPNNRLKTCKQCHDGKKRPEATAGFVSFGPHANSHDFSKYPQMWIASKFMVGLLVAVFTFFWAHSGLWYYRELQDRKARKTVPHVRSEALPPNGKKHFERFSIGWRVTHLAFALITMTLALTGTAALYADSAWAPVVAETLGGAAGMALVHRVAAFLFISIFLIHVVVVMQRLLRDRKFRWFGPDSLVPNWKDLADCTGMFKWFVGKGPRPRFDRWAYFEKFDYWAVFWGVAIIGGSGMLLAFPHVVAAHLPGWVFNVATVIHGEEAFLATVFLFTVHFFNNHFRPDKLPPPDVVMFTGTLSLEEFRRDHPAHYQRLVDSGELEKHLVDAPSAPLTLGSKILGLVLIAFGLTLLVLVGIGFFGRG